MLDLMLLGAIMYMGNEKKLVENYIILNYPNVVAEKN